MERMRECEWFCANCLQMLDALNKHGRCPYCESNAVDVAYRWRLPGRSRPEVLPLSLHEVAAEGASASERELTFR